MDERKKKKFIDEDEYDEDDDWYDEDEEK